MLKSAAICLTLILSSTTVAQSAEIGPISGLLFDLRNSTPFTKEGFRERTKSRFRTLTDDRPFNRALVAELADSSMAIVKLGIQNENLSDLLKLDLDQDGELDKDEIVVWADDAFSRYDLNNNGALSSKEIAIVEADLSAYRSQNPSWQQIQANLPKNAQVVELAQPSYFDISSNPPIKEAVLPIKQENKCSMPPISPSDHLVLLGFYEGFKQADVTLSGQDGDQTFVVDVAIDDGSDPLYIVLSSHSSTLYRFTGAVERISTVVPTSSVRKANSGGGIGGTGVVGVDREKVAFLSDWNCLSSFNKAGGVDEAKARGELFRILGRQPDHIGATYALDAVQLPSMNIGIVERDHHREMNEGRPVVPIDPTSVVSAIPAERWEIMPGPAGIKQLEREGYLKPLDNENGYNQEYKIVKPFSRFPASLSGGFPYKFMLGRGVRTPDGFAGWSCILSEETGLPIGNNPSPHC